ncbi:hypothetical protein D3C76_1612500 [compost metagenome]
MFVEQWQYRLRGVVAGGKAGAAGGQHYLHFRVGDPARKRGADLVDIVLDQVALDQHMPSRLQQIDEGLPGAVGVEGARVADGQHGDVQRFKRALRQMGHGLGFP